MAVLVASANGLGLTCRDRIEIADGFSQKFQGTDPKRDQKRLPRSTRQKETPSVRGRDSSPAAARRLGRRDGRIGQHPVDARGLR